MNMDTTLASVMKNIADALQLDSNNKLEVVYLFNISIDLKKKVLIIVPRKSTLTCTFINDKCTCTVHMYVNFSTNHIATVLEE